MAHAETLKRKIAGAEQMGNVVGTMKALAAVNIRQYERAAHAVEEYADTFESALQAVLRIHAHELPRRREHSRGREGFVVFGADQAMAGQFNEQVVDRVRQFMNAEGIDASSVDVLALGMRVHGLLEGIGLSASVTKTYPASLARLSDGLYEVVSVLDEWLGRRTDLRITMFYNRPLSGTTHKPESVVLLPIDRKLVNELAQRDWKSSCVPMIGSEWLDVYRNLVRQHVSAGVLRAFVDSLASENAARLAAMQAAEKSIDERLDELRVAFNSQRQAAITEELLDIVAGFEALKK